MNGTLHARPWTGGDAVLVQVGDILDRGVGEVTALLRILQLSSEAEAAGGEVIALMVRVKRDCICFAFHCVAFGDFSANRMLYSMACVRVRVRVLSCVSFTMEFIYLG